MPETDEVNRLVLVARIAAVSVLRYTPAGLPAIDLELEHESRQNEVDTQREVRLRIKAVAFGELARRLTTPDPSQSICFKGFLVSPRFGKSVTFHVQDFNTI